MLGACLLLGVGISACDDDIIPPSSPALEAFSVVIVANAASTAAVVDQVFEFASGAALAPGLAGVPTTVTFTSGDAFSIGAGGNTATGAMSFGSCVFTVEASSILPELPVSTVVIVDPCSLTVASTGTITTGDSGEGTVTLRLSDDVSSSNDASIGVTIVGDDITVTVDDNTMLTGTVDGPLTGGTGGTGGTGTTG